MVRDYNVISKGKYEYKQTNEFLQIERFLIVRKKKRRMLLLEMENCSSETLTAIKLQIEQFDVRGKDLGPTTFELKTAYKKGGFILKKAIPLHHSCIDFRVKVVAAEYGNYVYRLGEEDTYVTYEKKKKRRKLSESVIRKKTGKEGHLAKKRRFKAPVFVGIFAAIILLGAAAVSFAQLYSYKESKDQFFIQNLRYEFIDGNNEEGAPVYITGYIGLGGENIVIPNTVEGHPVQGIAQGAFANNSLIETLTVQEGVTISMDAFYNCGSLREVTLLGDNVVEPYAFASCSNLEKVQATNLLYAGDGAFSQASDLRSVRIESSAGNTGSVIFGDQVFTGVEEMDEIYIDRYIVYGDTCQFFGEIGSLEKLHLKNLNYALYSMDGALDKTLLDLFGAHGIKVSVVEIEYADTIPAFLTENCGSELKEFSVHTLQETVVGDKAFMGCSELTAVNIPKLVTEVGASAFEGTAISSFNALALKKMGAAAFKDCTELTEFQVDVISELESIPREAFSGCEALEIMYVPAKVEKVGDKAFYGCEKLETFTFAMDGLLTEIGNNAFELCKKLNTLTLPTRLEVIGSEAFKTCNRLNYISIPQSVEEISEDAFAECYRLYEIEELSHTLNIVAGEGLGEFALVVYHSASDERMPKKTVGEYILGEANDTWYLLWYTGSDSELTLPTVDGIQNYVLQSYFFIDSEAITAVNIPNQVGELGKKVFHESEINHVRFMEGTAALTFTQDTFKECESITDIHFNTRAFDSVEAGFFQGCTNLSTIELPTGLKSIGVSAFAECASLTTITGGQGVEVIGDSAFNSCSQLESFAFSSKLTEIGEYAFKECVALKNFKGATSLISIGKNAFERCSALAIAELPLTLTSIGEGAFIYCTALQSVTIPKDVKTIENDTFFECTALTQVFGGANLERVGDFAFAGCSALSAINLQSLSVIGERTFAECSALSSVAVPKLTQMGNAAFYACSALSTMTLPEGLTILPEEAFAQSGIVSVNGGEGLQQVGTRAFYNCNKLKSFAVPVNLEVIGVEAFSGCSALNGVKFNAKLQAIGDYAFQGCNALTSVSLNDKLSYVGPYAFASCSALTSVDIGNDVLTISNNAFSNCPALQNVTIGDNVSTISNNAFSYCSALQNVTIGDNVGSIGNYAFEGCAKLKTLSVGKNLGSIGAYAFASCAALNVLNLGEGLQNIGDAAFNGCIGLTSIVLPDSVSFLGSAAFQNCTGLTEVRLSDKITQIYNQTFEGCSQLNKIYLGNAVSWIGSSAFSGCDQLHEVYYTPSYMFELTKDTYDNGGIAYNALVLHTDENAKGLQTVTVGNFVFKTDDENWFLVGYTGSDTSLTLGAMKYGSKKITEYEIARYAFQDCTSLQSLYFDSAVTYVRSYSFSNLTNLKTLSFWKANTSLMIPSFAFNDTGSLETLIIPKEFAGMASSAFEQIGNNFHAYYGGSWAEWASNSYKFNIDSSYWYYKDNCIHYSQEWNWADEENQIINTEIQEFASRVLTEATCTENGLREYYCEKGGCTDGYNETIWCLGHQYKDSECIRCQHIDNLQVDADSWEHFCEIVTVTNDAKNPFDLFKSEETCIYAPDVYSITSTLEFKAERDIDLAFAVYVGGNCEFTITMSTGEKFIARTDDVNTYSWKLMKGESITFTYVDKREIVEEDTEVVLPEDDSADSAVEPLLDDVIEDPTTEAEPATVAYIYGITVSSLDESV